MSNVTRELLHEMPTIVRRGPYRFFFWSRDCVEPMHIHVERDTNIAKFWLDPVRLERSGGFRPAEIRRVERLIQHHEDTLIEGWHEHCG